MPELNDERLSRLLRSVAAAPGDAAWSRAMARLRTEESAPSWLAWALRPAALATAAGMLVCVAGAALWWNAQRDDTSLLAQQVLAAGGASDTELSVTLGSSAASDSGAQP